MTYDTPYIYDCDKPYSAMEGQPVELLCMAVSNTHSDPIKDERGCYKLGDVVMFAEQGHGWGTQETIPPAQGGKFFRVRITDACGPDLKARCQAEWSIEPTEPERDLDGRLAKRRRVHIDYDALPQAVKDAIQTDGVVALPWSSVAGCLKDKVSNTVQVP